MKALSLFANIGVAEAYLNETFARKPVKNNQYFLIHQVEREV